ncbi:MAG: fimbrial protein [Luteibacter sp.]
MSPASAVWCALLFLVLAAPASAGCVSHPSQGAAQPLSFGVLHVANDLPVGAVIAEQRTAAWTSPGFTCFKPTRTATLGIFTTASGAGERVYDTNVPGVGIRIHFSSKGYESPVPEHFPTGWSYKEQYTNAHFRVELIKTGPIASGGALSTGTIGRAGYDGTVQAWVDLVEARVEPERPTCAFVTRGLTFALGRVDGRELAKAGSSPWVTHSLVTTGCTATQMLLSFGAPAHPDDASLFAVSGSHAATGVGVELRSVEPDAPAMPNSVVPLVLKAASEGQGYHFRARYRTVGRVLTPGSANASIVVNVGYR